MSATAEITPESMAHMRKSMADLQRWFNFDGSAAIKMAAYMFCRSMATRTKKGAKRRNVTAIPGRKNAWLIEAYTQQQGVKKLFSSQGKSDPRAVIRRRGLLKASWFWLQLETKGKRPTSQIPGVRVDKTVETELQLTGEQQFIELVNKLNYVTRAAPGVADEAMSAASRGIQHWMERKTDMTAQRVWK
jgi:hypothetical protein